MFFLKSIEFVQVAQENFRRTGVFDKISLLLGPASETLKSLNPEEPFDLVFIDADKVNVAVYFEEAKRLVRKGGVIVRTNPDDHFFLPELTLLDCRQRHSFWTRL